MMLAISIGAIPRYARTVRASILTVKEQEFIEAAHAIGASDLRIILKHIFRTVWHRSSFKLRLELRVQSLMHRR